MTTYNTGSDSANTGVRAFLTKIGEFYLGRSFNTASGEGKKDWIRIKKEVFESKCAYCNSDLEKPTIEHLVMFNRTECGLHHPGNIVPCCSPCNKRDKDEEGNYLTWERVIWRCCAFQESRHRGCSDPGRTLALNSRSRRSRKGQDQACRT